MSVRREDTASKPDDLQTGSSWIPVTPAKPGSTDRQPICTNRGENETVEANWVETEKIAPIKGIEQAADFVQNREPACYTSTSLNNASEGTSTSSHVYEENLIGFESWLAGEAAANPHLFRKDTSTYNNSSINDPGKWKNISFGNLLLAMSKKEAMEKAVAHNDFATSSTSSCCLHPQFEGSSSEDRARADFVNARMVSTHYFHPQAESSQLTMCSGNSLRQDQHTYTGVQSPLSTFLILMHHPEQLLMQH